MGPVSARSIVFSLLALLLASPALAQQQESPVPVVIELALKVRSPKPLRGAVVLKPTQGDPIRVPVSSSETLTARVPAGTAWEIAPDLPGFWGPRKPLAVGTADREARIVLDLWPLGSISGRLKLDQKGAALPRQILVKTLAAPAFAKHLPAPKGALDCPVDEAGAWTCSLPAATFDLVVAAEGFTPHYLWGVQVPAATTRSLGTLELARGGSVAGWVAVESGAIDSGRCIARLSTYVGGGADAKAAFESESSAVEREVRGDGFFQLTGLAPGTYGLEIHQPGYSPARVAPLRVTPQGETFLEQPLLLKRPLILAFEIVPALDWIGHPWKVEVTREGEADGQPSPLVFEGSAGPDGRGSITGQSPGRFRIGVLDSLGNRVAVSDATLDAAFASPHTIEVELITLEGTVRLGDVPIAAELWFGGRFGETRVKVESDPEGSFQGILPRDGPWTVDIQAAEPRLSTRARVEVKADRAGRALTEIVLPDTRVFGTVVDDKGDPVPGADVLFMSERIELLERADAAGRFEIRGLPQGPSWLNAVDEPLASGRVFVSLVPDRTVGPIELRLRRSKRMAGTVVSPDPVSGARVDLIASIPSDGGGGTARTGQDGSFEIDVPEPTQRVVAVVSAPGFALRAFERGAGEPLTLPVSTDGGQLEIRLGMKTEDLVRRDLGVAIFQNGIPVPSSLVRQWAQDQGQWPAGQDLRIPNVASGEYRICLVPVRLPLEGDPARAGAACDSGLLPAGGSLSLRLDLPL